MKKNSPFMIAGVEVGQLNAMVKNLMIKSGINDPVELIRLINSGELFPICAQKDWIRIGGVFYFPVSSSGLSGQQWVQYFEDQKRRITSDVSEILLSENFEASNSIYYIALIPGGFFSDRNRVVRKIWREAKMRRFALPTLEAICLIREKFSNDDLEEMGFNRVIALHKPIMNVDNEFVYVGTKSIFKTDGLGSYNSFGVKLKRRDALAFIVKDFSCNR